jgi:phosphoribosylformimino-5-aminoimidazole carboxamide ribonucleotide (ProFAR) isomerase
VVGRDVGRLGGRRLAGAIIGKALYEGRFERKEAQVACSPPG